MKWACEYYFKKAFACRVRLAMDLCSVQGRRWSENRCRVCWITATSAGNGLQLQTGVVNSCQANYRASLETLNNMTHMWKATFLTFAFSSKNFLNRNLCLFSNNFLPWVFLWEEGQENLGVEVLNEGLLLSEQNRNQKHVCQSPYLWPQTAMQHQLSAVIL